MEMFGDYPQNITWKRYSFSNHPYEKYQSNSTHPWRIQAEGMAPQSLEVNNWSNWKTEESVPNICLIQPPPTYLPTVFCHAIYLLAKMLWFLVITTKKTSKLFEKSLMNDFPHLFLKKPTNPTKNLSPFSPCEIFGDHRSWLPPTIVSAS